MSIKKYFHIDDEVLRVSWIPSALRTYHYQKHKAFFGQAKPIEHDPDSSTWSFNLLGEKLDLQVEYSIFEKGDELLKNSGDISKDSIIILDFMALTAEQTGQTPAGLETLEKLLKININREYIYVLTAFERVAREFIDNKLDETHILTKPIDALTLAPILLTAAGVFYEH